MKSKQIILTTITIILALPLVFAMYSGTCNSIDFPNEDAVNWSVEGNSSNMDGFSFTKNGTNITYCLHPLFKSDNFTITFYNSESVEVPVDNGGSRGGRRKVCLEEDSDWQLDIINHNKDMEKKVDDKIVINNQERVIEYKIPKVGLFILIVLFILLLVLLKITYPKYKKISSEKK